MADWGYRLPIGVAAGVSLLLCLLFIISPDADLVYVFLVAPLALLACLVLLVNAAVRRRGRQSLSIFTALVALIAISGAFLKNEREIRPWLRWQLHSGHFKTQVLTQNPPANNELKHVEWDGWGGAPVGDWTAYVVFDPKDSLLMAAKNHSSGRFSGIPCDVHEIRRLESHWYSVTLSMNEWWD